MITHEVKPPFLILAPRDRILELYNANMINTPDVNCLITLLNHIEKPLGGSLGGVRQDQPDKDHLPVSESR